MGLQDRDYMHERPRARAFTPARPGPSLTLVWILSLVAAGYLIYRFADAWVERAPRAGPAVLPAAAVPPSTEVASPAGTKPDSSWFRCTVAGQVMYSEQPCPNEPTSTVQPATRPVPEPATGATTRMLYHCKSYAGATFWTTAHCHQRQALVDRMVTVPAHLGFEQQMKIAEQQRHHGESLAQAARNTVAPGTVAMLPDTTGACAALAARIAHLDALSRQPLPIPALDRIRQERKETRDAQFRQGC